MIENNLTQVVIIFTIIFFAIIVSHIYNKVYRIDKYSQKNRRQIEDIVYTPSSTVVGNGVDNLPGEQATNLSKLEEMEAGDAIAFYGSKRERERILNKASSIGRNSNRPKFKTRRAEEVNAVLIIRIK